MPDRLLAWTIVQGRFEGRPHAPAPTTMVRRRQFSLGSLQWSRPPTAGKEGETP